MQRERNGLRSGEKMKMKKVDVYGLGLIAIAIIIALVTIDIAIVIHSDEIETHEVGVEVYIYRNGELVYRKIGDPVTLNFVHLFTIMAGAGGVIINEEGETWTGYETFDDKGSKVCISNGTGSFGRNMNILPGTQLCSSSPISVNVVENDNRLELIFSGTVNVDRDMNITWIGLYLKLAKNSCKSKFFLVLADQVDMQVQAGDTITIVYKLVFP